MATPVSTPAFPVPAVHPGSSSQFTISHRVSAPGGAPSPTQMGTNYLQWSFCSWKRAAGSPGDVDSAALGWPSNPLPGNGWRTTLWVNTLDNFTPQRPQNRWLLSKQNLCCWLFLSLLSPSYFATLLLPFALTCLLVVSPEVAGEIGRPTNGRGTRRWNPDSVWTSVAAGVAVGWEWVPGSRRAHPGTRIPASLAGVLSV